MISCVPSSIQTSYPYYDRNGNLLGFHSSSVTFTVDSQGAYAQPYSQDPATLPFIPMYANGAVSVGTSCPQGTLLAVMPVSDYETLREGTMTPAQYDGLIAKLDEVKAAVNTQGTSAVTATNTAASNVGSLESTAFAIALLGAFLVAAVIGYRFLHRRGDM